MRRYIIELDRRLSSLIVYHCIFSSVLMHPNRTRKLREYWTKPYIVRHDSTVSQDYSAPVSAGEGKPCKVDLIARTKHLNIAHYESYSIRQHIIAYLHPCSRHADSTSKHNVLYGFIQYQRTHANLLELSDITPCEPTPVSVGMRTDISGILRTEPAPILSYRTEPFSCRCPQASRNLQKLPLAFTTELKQIASNGSIALIKKEEK